MAHSICHKASMHYRRSLYFISRAPSLFFKVNLKPVVLSLSILLCVSVCQRAFVKQCIAISKFQTLYMYFRYMHATSACTQNFYQIPSPVFQLYPPTWPIVYQSSFGFQPKSLFVVPVAAYVLCTKLTQCSIDTSNIILEDQRLADYKTRTHQKMRQQTSTFYDDMARTYFKILKKRTYLV